VQKSIRAHFNAMDTFTRLRTALGRTLFCLLVLDWGFTAGFTHGPDGMPPWILLDFANLGIHESGHVIFSFFGEFIMILGGSLMQLIFPAVVVLSFAWQKSWYEASFGIFWFSESLANVGHYVADARAMVLPLTGGEGTIHDWNWLLTRTHLLPFDVFFGDVLHVWAVLGMTVGWGLMVWITYREACRLPLRAAVNR